MALVLGAFGLMANHQPPQSEGDGSAPTSTDTPLTPPVTPGQ
jgi:hypothetical protein